MTSLCQEKPDTTQIKDSGRKDSKRNTHPKWESMGFILTLLSSCVRYKTANFILWNLTFLSAIFEKEIRGWALCNTGTDRRSFQWFHKYSFPTEPPITQQIHRVFLQYAKYNMYQRWHLRFGAVLQCTYQIGRPLKVKMRFQIAMFTLEPVAPPWWFSATRSSQLLEKPCGSRAQHWALSISPGKGCPCGSGLCNRVLNVFSKLSCALCG